MKQITELDIYSLDKIILAQHYSNSYFRTNWISFRNYMAQYNRDKEAIEKRNIVHLLVDFYWQNFMKIKNFKEIFKNYEIDIVEDHSTPIYKNDNIHLLRSKKEILKKIIKYNVDKFINQQLAINLESIKQLN